MAAGPTPEEIHHGLDHAITRRLSLLRSALKALRELEEYLLKLYLSREWKSTDAISAIRLDADIKEAQKDVAQQRMNTVWTLMRLTAASSRCSPGKT